MEAGRILLQTDSGGAALIEWLRVLAHCTPQSIPARRRPKQRSERPGRTCGIKRRPFYVSLRSAAALYWRLKAAAESVCALLDGRDLVSQACYRICWQSALGTAVAQVDQSALTKFHRAQCSRSDATAQTAQN